MPRISAVEKAVEQQRKRALRATVAFVAALIFLAAVVASTVITNVNQDTSITHIQQSAPCQVAPGSRACQVSITGAVKTCKKYEPCRHVFLALVREARHDTKGGGHSGSPPGGGQPGGGPSPAPSPPPKPGPVKQITKTVCSVNALGVKVCQIVPVG